MYCENFDQSLISSEFSATNESSFNTLSNYDQSLEYFEILANYFGFRLHEKLHDPSLK